MKDLIEGVLSSIQQRFIDAFSGLADFWYLAGWYAWFAVFVVVCIVARIFLPFKWVQVGLAIAVGLWAAFIAGLQVMANHAKADNQHYRDKIRELQAGQRDKSGGGWFS